MLVLEYLLLRRKAEALDAESFESAEDVEHERRKVVALLLVGRKGIGQEVKKHGLATADFAIEEEALWRLDLESGFLDGDCTSQGQIGAFIFVPPE